MSASWRPSAGRSWALRMSERETKMKMIWAVIRSSKVELVARRLKGMGVSGCTVYPVRGYGEQWRLYEPLFHGGHHKLEAIVEDGLAEKAAREIADHASAGLAGDGVLSIYDLDRVVLLRTKKTLT